MTLSEINNNVNTTLKSDQNGGTASIGFKREASIKLFFEENLTRKQIGDEFGEAGLKLFDMANIDGDETISQSEFDSYITTTQKTNAKSGKRTATGGVYVVQSGDTLSAIANDFGIDLDVLFVNNKPSIGNNKNKIYVGQKLNISTTLIEQNNDTEKEKEKENFQNKILSLNIPARMKKVISDETGINFEIMSNEEIAQVLKTMSLEDLNKILNTALTKCDKKDLIEFKKQLSLSNDEGKTVMRAAILQLSDKEGANKIFETLSKSLNIDMESCKKLSLSELTDKIKELDKGKRIELMKMIGNASLDSEIFLTGLDENSKSGELLKYYGIDDLTAIPKDRRPKKLAEAIVQKKQEDLDENNKSSLYNKYLNDLKNGLFTKKELKDLEILGLSTDSVPENKLKEMARERVYTGHIKALNNAGIDLVLDKGDLETFKTHVQALSTSGIIAEARANGVDTSSASTTISLALEDESLSKEEKQEISNILVENSKGLGVEYLEDDLFAAVSTAVYNNSDIEHSTQYSNDYKDRSEILKEVLEYVINNTSDADKKSILQQVYSVVNENYNNTSNSSTNKKQASNGQAVAGTVSNPIVQTRQESIKYYEEKGYNTIFQSNEDVVIQTARQSVRRISLEMSRPEQLRYTADKISKINNNISDAISSYKNLSEEEKKIVKKYLDGAKSQPNNIISFMLQGGQEVEQFMLRENIITVQELVNNIRPDDFDKFSDFIKGITSNLISKDVEAGTLKPEQMTSTQLKMFEYYKAQKD